MGGDPSNGAEMSLKWGGGRRGGGVFGVWGGGGGGGDSYPFADYVAVAVQFYREWVKIFFCKLFLFSLVL